MPFLLGPTSPSLIATVPDSLRYTLIIRFTCRPQLIVHHVSRFSFSSTPSSLLMLLPSLAPVLVPIHLVRICLLPSLTSISFISSTHVPLAFVGIGTSPSRLFYCSVLAHVLLRFGRPHTTIRNPASRRIHPVAGVHLYNGHLWHLAFPIYMSEFFRHCQALQ